MGGLLSAPPTTVKPGFAVAASVTGGGEKRGEESDGSFFMSRGDRFSKPSAFDFFCRMLIRALANVPYFCGKTAYEHPARKREEVVHHAAPRFLDLACVTVYQRVSRAVTSVFYRDSLDAGRSREAAKKKLPFGAHMKFYYLPYRRRRLRQSTPVRSFRSGVGGGEEEATPPPPLFLVVGSPRPIATRKTRGKKVLFTPPILPAATCYRGGRDLLGIQSETRRRGEGNVGRTRVGCIFELRFVAAFPFSLAAHSP